MYELDLESAVSEITQACEARLGRLSPFFFIVGAGISAPTIPLATDIESECKAVAARHGRSAEPKNKNPIDTYSHWFELAFPNPEQRQRYLRKKIQGKQISPAVFRLAHLLLSKAAGNIVVTPNFDDFLSRALTLFGEQYVICDHPSTVGRISLETDDIQIVHVHGTYWFYDCCNLKGEIAKRASQFGAGPVTIASFLEHLLWNRSPIVMGYSGWEGDVIMNALNNRLQSPLPFNLYWFSYNRSDCDKLPAWITGNPNVRFVVPGSRGMSVGADSQVSDIAAAEIPNVGERGGAGPTLPARKVLDLLVKSFTLDSPPLTKAPLQFFADQLGQSVFREEEDNSGIDIYSFQSVVARVQLAARLLAAKERAQSDVERTMEKVRDALRRSDYRGAIEAANSIPIADAEQRQLEELMAVTSTAADNLGDNSSDQIQAYGLIAAAAEHIARGDATNPHISISWAHALVRKTNVLLAMKQYEKVVAICDELAKRFRNAKEPEILEQVGRGLNNKGHSLSQLDRKEEAIRVYSQVVELFGNATEPRLCARAAAALFNTSTTLGELKRYQDAITVCDDVINRFGHSAEPDLVNMVIRAMNNKAWNLSQLSRYAEAISLCDEVIRHFGQRDEPEVRDAVNRALLSKGIAAKQLSKYDDGLSALDEVVKRLKGTTKPPMLEFIAKALLIKAQIFKTLGEKEQLLTVYSEMVQAFEGHSHEPLRPYLVLVKKMLKEHDQAVATQIDPS